jgi:hypothetical protein
MKALTRYAPDVSYAIMAEDITHIIVPLELHELTAGFAPDFYSLQDDIHATSRQEEVLSFAVFRAESFVLSVDRDIDGLIPPLLNAVLASLGNNKAHPFYVFLVGDQTVGEICDPVLGTELETVRAWVGPLQTFADPSVQTYGERLARKVAEADERVALLAVAEHALKAFREIGGHKLLVDRVNALRAFTYGSISRMIDDKPEANLPGDFADRVFEFERIRRRRRPVTVSDLEKQVLANEKEHTALLERLATAKEAATVARAARQKVKAKPVEHALSAATKKQAALQMEIARLQAQLAPSAPQ